MRLENILKTCVAIFYCGSYCILQEKWNSKLHKKLVLQRGMC